MRYSKECEYAIRAAVFLAEHPENHHYPLEISTQEEIPQHVVLKIMGTLAANGIVKSTDGDPAGYTLLKQPEAVSLFDIKVAVDGNADLLDCAIGLGECNDKVPCALHESYKPLRKAWVDYLEQTHLQDLAQALQDKRKELSGN